MGNSTSCTPEQFYKAMDERVEEELRLLIETEPPSPTSLEAFKDISSNFHLKFPIDTGRVASQNSRSPEELESYINSAHPVIHEKLLPFLAKFLFIKQNFGTNKEKQIYKDMHILGLVERMLKKRPMVFVGAYDRYFLPGDTFGVGGFDLIGQSKEDANLPIKKFMTYDEIKLAALMSVSSKSYFINNGFRDNKGVVGEEGTFQKNGIIIGQVGARFQKPGKMDWQDCIVTPAQNCKEHGYGTDPELKHCLISEWAKLWNSDYFPTWKEITDENNCRCSNTLWDKIKFNDEVYKTRMAMTIEIFISEANQQARQMKTKAYLHVLGLGLGVWGLVECQSQLYVDTWGEVLSRLQPDSISHVDFSWIPVSTCNGTSNEEKINDTNITIYFSKRSLHDPIPDNMLLACHFAWDGNSLPGNEYWAGSLRTSGDPAAACSSGIAELHNALLNPQVSANNLHISSNCGVLHVSDYLKLRLSEK